MSAIGKVVRKARYDIPSAVVGVVGRGKLELDAVNAVDAVHEQDKDKDESDLNTTSAPRRGRIGEKRKYLDPVLQLRNQRIL